MKTISLLIFTLPFLFTNSFLLNGVSGEAEGSISVKTSSGISLIEGKTKTTDHSITHLRAPLAVDLAAAELNQMSLLKKGNSAFIEIPDEASRAGEKYFVSGVKKWGYWKIVSKKNDADFIMVFNIDKEIMLYKNATVTFKTKQNKTIKKSKAYRSGTSVDNGYNAFRGVANKLVNKYLKKEFK